MKLSAAAAVFGRYLWIASTVCVGNARIRKAEAITPIATPIAIFNIWSPQAERFQTRSVNEVSEDGKTSVLRTVRLTRGDFCKAIVKPEVFTPPPCSRGILSASAAPLDLERVADGSMRLTETMRQCPALQPPHLPLSSSSVQMRVLGTAVVMQSSTPMRATEAKTLQRCTVRSQSVSGGDWRLDLLILQQPPQESTRCTASRRFCTTMSITSPSSSTVRQIQTRSPAIFGTISWRCECGDGGSLQRGRLAAIFGPNFAIQARIVS